MVPQVGANGTRKKGFVYFTSFGNFYVTVPRPSLTTLRPPVSYSEIGDLPIVGGENRSTIFLEEGLELKVRTRRPQLDVRTGRQCSWRRDSN